MPISNFLFKVKRTLNKKSKKTDSKYNQKIIEKKDFNNRLKNMINSEQPFAISRIGATELDCIFNYENFSKFNSRNKEMMQNNAGFFPSNDNNLKKFYSLYIKDINDIDIFGYWKNTGEDTIFNKYGNFDLKITELKNIEPYYHENPWTLSLEGKNVLVIHPFNKTINLQYEKRDHLFKVPTLPSFNLISYSPPQTIGGESSQYSSWFDALENTLNEIDKIEFDIALIGAGAYGLPIAAHIKRSNKQAIHFGGSLQILFGIKGKRWDEHPYISGLYNDKWVRPMDIEKPTNFKNVEKGCYW